MSSISIKTIWGNSLIYWKFRNFKETTGVIYGEFTLF